MVKNTTGGNKHKKNKNKAPIKIEQTRDTLIHAEESKDKGILELYAVIKKKMGQKRFLVLCSDNVERSCCISGKMYKRYWCNIGDIILCNVEIIGNNNLCYLLHRYSPEHIKFLREEKPDPLAFIDKEKINFAEDNGNEDSDDDNEGLIIQKNTSKSAYDSISSESDDDDSDDDGNKDNNNSKKKVSFAMGNDNYSDSDNDSDSEPEDLDKDCLEDYRQFSSTKNKITYTTNKYDKKVYRKELDEEINCL